jgi:hypothetical protein
VAAHNIAPLPVYRRNLLVTDRRSNGGFARSTVCVGVAPGNSDATMSVEHPAVTAESSGRDWGEIGGGLAAAFALVGICVAGLWALVVLVGALA